MNEKNFYAINEDLNITCQDAPFAAEPGTVYFDTKASLAQAVEKWPTPKLVELWNSFAGAPPFGELKPVKRFADKTVAVTRIWNALSESLVPVRVPKEEKKPVKPKEEKSEKEKKTKTPKAPRAANGKHGGEKYDKLVELMKRSGGATMNELAVGAKSSKSSVANMVYNIRREHGGFSKTINEKKEAVYSIAEGK